MSTADDLGFLVWLQGGPGDGVRVQLLPEPPNMIVYMPGGEAETDYVRVPEAEQFAFERIYYPKDHPEFEIRSGLHG